MPFLLKHRGYVQNTQRGRIIEQILCYGIGITIFNNGIDGGIDQNDAHISLSKGW